MDEPKFTRKTLLIGGAALLVLLLLSAIPTAIALLTPHFHGTPYIPPVAVSDFSLSRADGGTFRLSDLRGKIVVVYFGYTTCPDVCPTTLWDLHRALGQLGQSTQDVAVVFVTVDPQTDTPDKLTSYLSAFDPSFMGLYGSPDQLQAVYNEFGVAVVPGQEPQGGLTHTASIFVIDRSGKLRLEMHTGASPENMAEDLGYLIRE